MSTTPLARRLVAGACAGVVLVLLGATGAFGAFRASTSAGHQESTNSIVLPTPTVSLTCNGGSGKAKLAATWSAPSMGVTTSSTATFLNAYTVSITLDGSGVYTQTGGTTSTYSQNVTTSTSPHTATITVAVTSSTRWAATVSASASRPC
ncbi:hypothetical protein [Oryzihumus sp.]|jgi:hypothetical protein|uniref:hypothetical protein n=1 Tax=Oryzihumus sp. TaxID=1968903 RepID=UPI002EDBA6F5